MYHRPPNLKDLLVRATISNPGTRYEGNHQSLHLRCKPCRHLKTDAKFESSVTGETFKVLATATCKTSNVIYLIQCLRCKKQHVGESEHSLCIRLNGHRSDKKNYQIEKPVAIHFSLVGHSMEDREILIIEKIHREDAVYRRRKESYWINTL